MSAAIEFQDVVYRVGGRDILRGLNLSVEEGETLALLGRSGSGKTTALRMVNALLYPTSGQVRVRGRSTRDWDPIRLRRGIGYVIQDIGLFPHYTVADNISLVPGLEGWDAKRTDERMRAMLDLVGLPPEQFAARRPRELSGGQRQRVGVARALAADPPLLLFDEPFGALDPVTRLELQRQFLSLRRELRKTSVFVTHDVREALVLGSRIAVLRDGVLERVAPPAEFARSRDGEAAAFLACLDWSPQP